MVAGGGVKVFFSLQLCALQYVIVDVWWSMKLVCFVSVNLSIFFSSDV